MIARTVPPKNPEIQTYVPPKPEVERQAKLKKRKQTNKRLRDRSAKGQNPPTEQPFKADLLGRDVDEDGALPLLPPFPTGNFEIDAEQAEEYASSVERRGSPQPLRVDRELSWQEAYQLADWWRAVWRRAKKDHVTELALVTRICEGTSATFVLKQLLYWSARKKHRADDPGRKRKLRGGKYQPGPKFLAGGIWYAKSRTQLAAETGLTPLQARSAVELLRQKKLVLTVRGMFGRQTTTWLRIVPQALQDAVKKSWPQYSLDTDSSIF